MRTETLITKLEAILTDGIDTLTTSADPYRVLFALVSHAETAGTVAFGSFLGYCDAIYSDPDTVTDDDEDEPDFTTCAVRYVMHGVGTELFNIATVKGMKLDADTFLSRENREIIGACVPLAFGTFRRFEKMATDARKILRGWEDDRVSQEQIDAVIAGTYGAKAKALASAEEADKRTDTVKATDGLVRAYVTILKLSPREQTKALRNALKSDKVKALAETLKVTPKV